MLKKIISLCTAVVMLMLSIPITQAAYTNEITQEGNLKIIWDFDKVAAADVVDDATKVPFVTEIPSPQTTTYPMIGSYNGLEFNCTGNSGAYVELAQPNGANNIDRINLYQGSYVKFTAIEDGRLTISGKAKKGSKLYCHTEFTDSGVSSLISASSDTEVPKTINVTSGTDYYIFNTQTSSAYQFKTLTFVSDGIKPTIEPIETLEPTSTPVIKPIQTVEPTENKIISFDERYVRVSIKDTGAVLYTASYEADGSLKAVERNDFNEIGEHDVVLKNSADKAMLWDCNMNPYDFKEVNYEPEMLSKEISLDRTSHPLYVGTSNTKNFSVWEDQGSSVVITADLHNSKYNTEDIQWSVSDDTTAYFTSVDKNRAEIKGKRTGYVIVTAKLPNGQQAVCSISVIDNAARLTTQRIEFNTDSLNLSSGQSANLKTIVYPKDIYQNGMLNQNILWESSDTSVTTVQDGKITAVANGTAVITATSDDVGKSAVCSVTVADGVTAETISGSNEILDITVGDTGVLDVLGENIIWKSDEGNVQGYKAGTVKIYAIAADSLTDVQISKIKELQEIRALKDNADIVDILETAVYSECILTVKDSSPYLRNLHTASEGITDNSINLLWNRATQIDSGDCDKYIICMNGEQLAVTDKLGYTANGLAPSTQYQFTVSAVDADGNELAREEITEQTKEKSIIINVLDYGAKGNGLVTDTYAIQKAIDACPENGTVWLPGGGRVYYSGALFLKDNMTFKVDGILIGSIDPKDYPRHITKWEGWRKLDQSSSEWPNSNSDSNHVVNNHYPHSSLINAGVFCHVVAFVCNLFMVDFRASHKDIAVFKMVRFIFGYKCSFAAAN